jgi:citrate/tricarballylate utilization protein
VPDVDLIREGQRIMTICNACRYCEGFCAVFPAMEQRLTFTRGDMNYLANLCHNCSECLHACQYAPPHAFAVNVPRTLAQIRVRSYQQYCWPQALRTAFDRHSVKTSLGLALGLFAFMLLASMAIAHRPLLVRGEHAQFYGVVSHDVIVGTFGAVFLFVLVTLGIGIARYIADTKGAAGDLASLPNVRTGLRDAFSLTYLHGSGADCATAEETRRPWRRWFHHLTAGGFVLCTASTSVAAIYHSVFGWQAPYGYTSLPVVLGTLGGVGLVIGPVGLWWIRTRRDPASTDPDSIGLDGSFMLLLVLTSLSGLALLVLRATAAMGTLLFLHFGFVMALFVTLPYGKFVHGLYRTVALIQYARECRVADAEGIHAA